MPAEDITHRPSRCQGPLFLLKTGLPVLLFFALVTTAAFFYFSKAAFIGFHDHDWGCFVDAAWRILRGQRIYVDFLFPYGPGHLYLQALFFLIFGFGKSAILWQLIVVNTAAVMAVFLAFYRRMPLVLCLAAAVLEMFYFQWAYPFPYYDYTAHLPGILAAAWLFRWLTSGSDRGAFMTGLVCGIGGMASVVTKINIGGIYGLVFGAVLLLPPARVRAFAGLVTGSAAVLALSFITAPSPQSYFEQVFIYTAFQMNRLVWLQDVAPLARPFYLLPVLVLAVAVLFFKKEKKEHAPVMVFFLGMWVIGTFSRLTSSSFKGTDFYFANAGLYAGAGFFILYRYWQEAAGKILKITALLALGVFAVPVILRASALYQFNDLRVKHNIGFVREYQMGRIPPERVYRLKTGPFRGWVHLDIVGEALDDKMETIRNLIAPDESFLILSSDQILYALTGRDGPLGMPFCWGVDNTEPPPGKLWKQVHDSLIMNPPDWILTLREDRNPVNSIMTYMQLPPEYLLRDYTLVRAWGDRALFRRNRL